MATQSTRNKCGMQTLAGSGAGTQPTTGAGTQAPRAPGTDTATEPGAFLHRTGQLPVNTGAVTTDSLELLAWVQLISRSKGLALISQKNWVDPRGSAGHPQLLQQQDCQHTGALLDTGQAMLKGALGAVTSLLTAV